MGAGDQGVKIFLVYVGRGDTIMLTTAVLSLLWGFVGPLIDLLPDIAFTDLSWSRSFLDYIAVALYFVPIDTFRTITGLIITFWMFRVVVAILKTFWDMLPVV